jgi:membrane-associated phospholipid phosphatase
MTHAMGKGPVEHDRVAPGVHTSHRSHTVPRELVLVCGGVLMYFGVRGLTVGNADVALRHAGEVVSAEQGLGVYVEPSVQGLVDQSHLLTTAANWIYIWGHWPVIALTLLWLMLDHPAGYRLTRDTLLASGVVGMTVFALYPVAPPRLAGLGLVDTVTMYSTSYRVLQPHALVNPYAAMPSLHVGWDLLMGIALFTYSQHRVIRLFGALLPALMAISVIVTANHYLVDAIVGAALVLTCRWAVQRLERRREAHGHVDGSGHPPADAPAKMPGQLPHPELASRR